MLERKKMILSVVIVILLLGSIGYFVEHEVNKVIKSMDEIPKSIYKLEEHLH